MNTEQQKNLHRGLKPLANLTRRWGVGPTFGVLAFAESVFEPIVIDTMMLTLAGLQRGKILWMVFCGTVGTTLGAAFLILLTQHVMSVEAALVLMERFGNPDLFIDARIWLNQHGWLALAVGSLTALPFFLIIIALVLAGMPWWQILLGTVVFRGMRYALMGIIVHLVLQGTDKLDQKRKTNTFTRATMIGGFWMTVILTIIIGFSFLTTATG